MGIGSAFAEPEINKYSNLFGSEKQVEEGPRINDLKSLNYEFMSCASDFFDNGGSLELARDASKIKINGTRNNQLNLCQLKDLLESGAVNPRDYSSDLEKLQEKINIVGSMIDVNGNPLSIISPEEYISDIPIEYIDFLKTLSFVNYDGEEVGFFRTDLEIMLMYNGVKEVDDLKKLIDLKNSEGEPLFKQDYVKNATLTSGNIANPWNQLVNYCLSGGSFDEAKKFAQKGLDGVEINKYKNFGFSVDDFDENGKLIWEDTEKPNLLVVFPYGDHNGALDNTKFSKLRDTYDTDFHIVSTKTELYDALENSIDASTVIISGHGTNNDITFSFGIRAESESERKEGILRTEDIPNLQPYLKMLPEDARILLYSCSTAKGPNSFAENFAIAADGRVVFAADDLLAAREDIRQAYPLEIELHGKERTREGPYVNRSVTWDSRINLDAYSQ